MAEGSPTVRRRELGALLRKMREDKGMSVNQVTSTCSAPPSKISRIETGQRGATRETSATYATFMALPAKRSVTALWVSRREGKQQGWWQPYDLPDSTYVGLEQAATSLEIYHSAVVPGLLQTADYARAVHEGGIPKLNQDVIEQRIEVRIRRQMLLSQGKPPGFHAVLDEAALYRQVGGPRVMYEQLKKIIDACERPRTSVQVLPYTVGAHPAMESNFTILKLDTLATRVSRVVYVEGLVGQIYLDRPQDTDRYLQAFAQLTKIALNPQDSVDLLRKTCKVYLKGLAPVGSLETYLSEEIG